jgi:DNA-binding response OmpR family regulator
MDSRILVVEDTPANIQTLSTILKQEGYQISVATNGRQALQVLERVRPDLILLDIMMPEMDGFEVLRRLKEDARLRHVPVIMISALDDIDSVVRCVELGAEDHLPKPFDPVLLKARIGACLEKKRWHDQEAAYLARIEHQMQEIERERARADRLLHAILPPSAVVFLASVARGKPLVVDQLQLGGIDEPGQRVRVGLEDENVALEQRPISGRDIAAVALADDGSHCDAAIAQRFELPYGLADAGRSRGHGHLGDIVLRSRSGSLASLRSLLDPRQEPPSDAEEGDARDSQADAYRSEVEHAKRLAGDLLAHARDDDIRRRADQGDESAEQ